MMNELTESAPERPPLLERIGDRYFERLSADEKELTPHDEIHLLNAQEREALKGIEHGAVVRAGVAGFLSAWAAALAAYFADPLYMEEPDAGWLDNLQYWLIVISVSVVAAVLEIAFLYWDALRSVHQLAVAAGLSLRHQAEETSAARNALARAAVRPLPAPRPAQETPEQTTAVRNALVRAALEMPSPTEDNGLVAPGAETSKLSVLAAGLLYKLKITLTNFLAKALVRRMMGRALVRAWMEFVAVPITAVWDGVVCWLILREARIRAMGPSAARQIVEHVFSSEANLTPAARAVALRGAASVVARNASFHPNLQCFFNEVLRKTRELNEATEQPPLGEAGDNLSDSRRFLERLAQLDASQQHVALKVLGAALIIDGRFSRWERKLFKQAQATCGQTTSLKAAKALRRSFRSGAADLLENVDRLVEALPRNSTGCLPPKSRY